MSDTTYSLQRLLLFLWCFTVVVSSITFLIIYYKVKPTETPLALHYNVIVGVDLLGKGTDLYKIPLASFSIIAVNALLSQLIKHRQSKLQIFIAGVTVAVTLILLFATLLLLTVN